MLTVRDRITARQGHLIPIILTSPRAFLLILGAILALAPIALTAPHDRVGIALVPFVGPSSPAASTSGHAPDKIACSSIPLPCLPGRLA
jgi:hypothetical protein